MTALIALLKPSRRDDHRSVFARFAALLARRTEARSGRAA